MTEAVRSPGSTLKPLIYGLAFELGLAHPESLIEDRHHGVRRAMCRSTSTISPAAR